MLEISINGLGVCFILVCPSSFFGSGLGLTGVRISGMGVPDQPPATAVATGKVLRGLYFDLGAYSQLLCRCEELLRSNCHSLLSRCV